MNIKYKSNNNIVYSCKYHIVWCPKYRRNVLTDKIAEKLKELIYFVANTTLGVGSVRPALRASAINTGIPCL